MATGTWNVNPNDGVNINNGTITFPEKYEDITYEISYTNNGVTIKKDFTVFACEQPPAPCADEYNNEAIGVFPYRQDYTGTGGTPIQVYVRKNGVGVTGLTANDFSLNIGENGQYNDAFTDIQIISEGGTNAPYVINITKANQDITCKYVGEILNCTIAPTACTEATANFTIMISETEQRQIKVSGMPNGLDTMKIGFEGYVGNCKKRVQMGDYTVTKENDGYGYATGNIYKNLVITDDTPVYLRVIHLEAPNYCQDHNNCARVISFGSTIEVKYCPNASVQNPCN